MINVIIDGEFLGSGKGAAMVACVAERNHLGMFIERDEETDDYETVEKIVID